MFAYYSGPSNRLESVFEAPLAAFRDAMIRRRVDVRQRMLYGRPIHSKFVLLSFLAEADVAQFEFLTRELGIVGVESVLFVLEAALLGHLSDRARRIRPTSGALQVSCDLS